MKNLGRAMSIVVCSLVIGLVLSSCSSGGDGGGPILPAPPSAPQNPSAASGVQQVTVKWNAVSGATSYNIYYTNAPGATKTTGTKISAVTSPYAHTNLTAGSYHYVVTAVSSAGESAASSEVSAPVNLLVFVTSVSGTGNLSTWPDAGGNSGLAAGDAVCQARATAAGLTGTFKAWLSDNTSDAYCRVHNLMGKKSANCGQPSLPVSAGPWIRTDGFPFADTIEQLVNNFKIYSPARFDESGVAVSRSYYFTGTQEDGVLWPNPPYNSACTNWTSGNAVSTISGNTDCTADGWTGWSSSCHYLSRLVCLQTGSGPTLSHFAAAGKKVFLTSVSGTGDLGSWPDAGGNTGTAAGDAVCRARATAAGLANAANFMAWLSDSTSHAIDRITSSGPWVRLDGVKIADNKADLTDGSLFTAIALTETGTHVSWAAWTGTGFDGTKTANNCNNWTDGTSSSTGTASRTSDAGPAWSNAWASVQCDMTSYRLYCFED